MEEGWLKGRKETITTRNPEEMDKIGVTLGKPTQERASTPLSFVPPSQRRPAPSPRTGSLKLGLKHAPRHTKQSYVLMITRVQWGMDEERMRDVWGDARRWERRGWQAVRRESPAGSVCLCARWEGDVWRWCSPVCGLALSCLSYLDSEAFCAFSSSRHGFYMYSSPSEIYFKTLTK